MAIKFDVSTTSIVVTCTECAYWFAFRFDRVEAYLAGETHAVRVHAVPAEIADNARVLYERRHAARS